MDETIKIWLLSMLTTELEEIQGSMRNTDLWIEACCPEELPMFEQNLEDMKEYKRILKNLITKVEEGTLDVD
jgi:hypothetical protein